MGIPQIIMIVWITVLCTVALIKHGETTEISFPATFIATLIEIGILYWGGFFG